MPTSEYIGAINIESADAFYTKAVQLRLSRRIMKFTTVLGNARGARSHRTGADASITGVGGVFGTPSILTNATGRTGSLFPRRISFFSFFFFCAVLIQDTVIAPDGERCASRAVHSALASEFIAPV